jgi:hypothetical protein
MGKKKALVALAHKILVIIWHLLKKGRITAGAIRPRRPPDRPPEDFQRNPTPAAARGSPTPSPTP